MALFVRNFLTSWLGLFFCQKLLDKLARTACLPEINCQTGQTAWILVLVLTPLTLGFNLFESLNGFWWVSGVKQTTQTPHHLDPLLAVLETYLYFQRSGTETALRSSRR